MWIRRSSCAGSSTAPAMRASRMAMGVAMAVKIVAIAPATRGALIASKGPSSAKFLTLTHGRDSPVDKSPKFNLGHRENLK